MKSVTLPLVSLASFGVLALCATTLSVIPGCGGKDLRGAPSEYQPKKKVVVEDDGLDDASRAPASGADGTAAGTPAKGPTGAEIDPMAGGDMTPPGGDTPSTPGAGTMAPATMGTMEPAKNPGAMTPVATAIPTMMPDPKPTRTAAPMAYEWDADVKPIAVEYCSNCHGAASNKKFKPADSEATWKTHKADALARIKSGNMPKNEQMDADKKEILVKWLESL